MAVSSTFTALGVSDPVYVGARGQNVTIALSGTYAASVQLQVSDANGGAWTNVRVPWTTANATVSYVYGTTSHKEQLRLRCTSFTSGTVTYSITDENKTLQVVKNSAGNNLYNRSQLGSTEHGNFTVDGVSTLTGAVTTAATPITTKGIGAVNGATVSAVENGDGVLHQTILTCTATPITMADDAATGQYGGVKVYDFPLGWICSLGAVCDGDFTAVEPWLDTWTGDMELGTAAPSDAADAVAGENFWQGLTAIGTATALVAAIDASGNVAADLTESGARWYNGTDTAADMYLNVVTDDDAGNTATTAAMLFTGTITFTWINLGAIAA